MFRFKSPMLGIVLGFVLATSVATWLVTATMLTHLKKDLPSVEGLSRYRPAQTTRIYARDGQLIGTLFRENRTWVPLDKMSPHLREAVLATEDSRFYEHRGVDPIGVARAAWANLTGGEVRQGASTITMQLARNLFLTQERSLERKAREALLALEIERKLSKDKILELYLNQAYFGSGAHGVGAACQLYFRKKPAQLTLDEAAFLAGLPQAPEELSGSPAKARERQREVLDRMLAVGALSQAQHRAVSARKTPVRTGALANKSLLKYPYFTAYVIAELSKRYDDRTLYEGGLHVYTTLDIPSQRKAERAVRNVIVGYGPGYNAGSGALVTVENKTGAIRAMVGGTGWTAKNQFNRAWQAQRQAGSTFKMFVYATALECGYTPHSLVADTPFEVAGWKPQNADGSFMGQMPLWRALMLSRNVVAARLVAQLGPQSVLSTAHRLGVALKAQPHLSLALGAVEVTPLEMASAISALPNDGLRMEPTAIRLVTNSRGGVLEDHRFPQGSPALSPRTARTLTHMLENVVQSGTGTAARLADLPVAGKTGTSDRCRDAWFVGYTPEWTTAVWVGNDRQQNSMWGCYGGTLPAYIWRDFMAAAAPRSVARFPTSGHAVRLCMDSWHKAGKSCRKVTTARLDSAPAVCVEHDAIDELRVAGVQREVVDGVATYSNTGMSLDDWEVTPVEPDASANG